MYQAKFFNFSDEAFGHPSLGGNDDHCQWNKSPYFFPPKTEMMLDGYIAEHLAKHLANRELQRPGNPYGSERDCSPKFPEQNPRFMRVFNMAYIPVKLEEATPQKHEMADDVKGQMSNFVEEPKTETKKSFCSQCDSKGVRHKKDCPTLKNTVEATFEGLETAK